MLLAELDEDERVPLLALVDGARTVSALLSDDDWDRLRGDVRQGRCSVEMVPCGLPGHLKTSQHGTRYFAHNPGGGSCDAHGGESPLHLAAKTEIIKGCADAGWEAEPEYRGDGWIADVAATKPGRHRVAFEVQVSRQTHDEYQRRQSRYAQAGVRCAWFVRHESSLVRATSDLPAFLLTGAAGELEVVVSGTHLPLREATTKLLNRAVKFCPAVSNATTEVTAHEYDPCWKCHRTYLVWKVTRETALGACGLQVEQYGTPFEQYVQSKPEARPEISRAIRARTATATLKPARMNRRSSMTVGHAYMAFSCPHCSAVCGDHFLPEFWHRVAFDEPAFTLRVPTASGHLEAPHWCLDIGDGHCAPPAADLAHRGLAKA